MLNLRIIPNIMEDCNREILYFPYVIDKTIEEYINEAIEVFCTDNRLCLNAKNTLLDYKNQKIILSGGIIGDLNSIPNNNEEIVVTPNVEDPVSVVVSIFTSVATWWSGLGAISKVFVGVTALASGYSVYKAVTMDIPSIPAYAPTSIPAMPSFGSAAPVGSRSSIENESPNYGWDGARTMQDVGLSIPITYGKVKEGGNVINQYVSQRGNKSYLHILLALGEGEIESIDDIKIDNNPIANYSGVTIYKRYGTNDQTTIPGFNKLHDPYAIGQVISPGGSYTYTTSNLDVEGFIINFTMPNGLFQQDEASGDLRSHTISITVSYRLHSGGAWTSTTITKTKKRQSAVRFNEEISGLTADQYDIKVKNNNSLGTQYQQATLTEISIDEIRNDNLSYPNTALLALDLLATEQINNARPNITFTKSGRKVSIPKIMYDGSEVDWEDYYYDDSDDEWKRFSDNAICTWNETTWINRWTENPVWCINKDLLVDTLYGAGDYIESTDISDSNILEMAKYCEERIPDGDGGYIKRFRMDVTLDSPTRALDMLQQLSTVFRAFPYYSEGTIKFQIDKPTNPSQLYGVGNILDDSFSCAWKSIKESYNSIEITFNDEDKEYKREILTLNDEDSLFTNGDPLRIKRVRLFTNYIAQAIHEARYLLYLSQNIIRSGAIKVSTDGLTARVGQVISVSHDVPQWGFSGRVLKDSTTSLVKLDREVTVEAGYTYEISVRFHDNDEPVIKTITDGAGTYTEVNVSSAFTSAPQEYDVYSFGQQDIQTKPVRMIGVARGGNGEVGINWIEYNEDVYSDVDIIIPETNYSALSTDIPDVEDLTLTEDLVILKDGTIGTAINVWFQKPVDTDYHTKQYVEAEIYLREGTTGDDWISKGKSSGTFFQIRENIYSGVEYSIAVVSISQDGANAITDSPSETITPLGKQASPSDVTEFEVSQSGNLLKFTWNPVRDLDLSRYIIKEGSSWSSGQIIAELIDTTEFLISVGKIGPITYMIKAMDTSENYSENPASDEIDVTKPPDMNFLNEFDRWSHNLKYELSNVSIIQRQDLDSNYRRPVLCLSSQETWEEWESDVLTTWEQEEDYIGEELGEGPFESTGYSEMKTPLDLGTIFEFKIVSDADYTNVAYGSVEIQISYSTNGTSYTSFVAVSASETYRAQYVKFKVILATTNTSYNIYLYYLNIFINAPVMFRDWGRDVLVPIGGLTIEFGSQFTYPPRFWANITNGQVGWADTQSVTTTQAVVQCKNFSNVAIAGAEISWDSAGY